eukprot:12073287-Alexandrium_andersonii.AAC.1
MPTACSISVFPLLGLEAYAAKPPLPCVCADCASAHFFIMSWDSLASAHIRYALLAQEVAEDMEGLPPGHRGVHGV